jgi:hypothetical protein
MYQPEFTGIGGMKISVWFWCCRIEPGVVLKMKTGDVIIFKSSEIIHFNLHYSGKRASLVFHTDRGARSWAKEEWLAAQFVFAQHKKQ